MGGAKQEVLCSHPGRRSESLEQEGGGASLGGKEAMRRAGEGSGSCRSSSENMTFTRAQEEERVDGWGTGVFLCPSPHCAGSQGAEDTTQPASECRFESGPAWLQSSLCCALVTVATQVLLSLSEQILPAREMQINTIVYHNHTALSPKALDVTPKAQLGNRAKASVVLLPTPLEGPQEQVLKCKASQQPPPQTPRPPSEKAAIPVDCSKPEAGVQFMGKQEMPPRV